MRKISEKMVQAILAGRNMREANTEVTERFCGSQANGRPVYHAEVRLHGNKIATLYFRGMGRMLPYRGELSLCGWNTVTTRERLSAILANCFPGFLGVCTKKGQPLLARKEGWYSAISASEPFTVQDAPITLRQE